MTTRLDLIMQRLEVMGYRVKDSGECLLVCNRTARSRTSHARYVSKSGITSARDGLAYVLEAVAS